MKLNTKDNILKGKKQYAKEKMALILVRKQRKEARKQEH